MNLSSALASSFLSRSRPLQQMMEGRVLGNLYPSKVFGPPLSFALATDNRLPSLILEDKQRLANIPCLSPVFREWFEFLKQATGGRNFLSKLPGEEPPHQQ